MGKNNRQKQGSFFQSLFQVHSFNIRDFRASSADEEAFSLLFECQEQFRATLVVMEMGYLDHLSHKIPVYASDFKREYLFIRGLNKYFKCLSKKLDCINHGLFESNISNKIKKYMKRFLRAQEKGKFNNINNLIIPSYHIGIIRDILFINEQFDYYKRSCICFLSDSDDDDDSSYGGYDDWGASLVDSKIFSGFKEFYNIFKKIFDQLNYIRYECESDSE